jgi:hypothetical protein
LLIVIIIVGREKCSNFSEFEPLLVNYLSLYLLWFVYRMPPKRPGVKGSVPIVELVGDGRTFKGSF